jgi:cytochrome o ubiquinol oxidase subunit III
MSAEAVAAPLPEELAEDAVLDERDFGFWVYLMSDAIIFALLFATYVTMVNRTAGGPAGHDLFNLVRTSAETLLLLCSSVSFGMASVAVAERNRQVALRWLAITFVLGAGFVFLEIGEFRGMIADGAGPDRSGFLSSFFALVGTHGLHVSGGLVWIAVMLAQISMKGFTPRVVSRLFRLGLFWHFLDIVWIGIFSVVYLPGVL